MSKSELEEILDLFNAPDEQAVTLPVVPAPRPLTIDEVAERIGAWLKVTDNPPRPMFAGVARSRGQDVGFCSRRVGIPGRDGRME